MPSHKIVDIGATGSITAFSAKTQLAPARGESAAGGREARVADDDVAQWSQLPVHRCEREHSTVKDLMGFVAACCCLPRIC